MNRVWMRGWKGIVLWPAVIAMVASASVALADQGAKNVIIFIGDGMGAKQIEACDLYTGSTGIYEAWQKYYVATWDLNTLEANGGLVGYDPNLAWSDFSYVVSAATDSASSATAIFAGTKVDSGNICTSHEDKTRLTNIAESAARMGKCYGAVSTVYISHATPGAFCSHNSDRGNGYAIADEALWGDPNTTGMQDTNGHYGSWGKNPYTPNVLIGAGHPKWDTELVCMEIRDKLAAENGTPGAWTFVERIEGSRDGGARLTAAANNPQVTKLAALFGSSCFDSRLADGSGYNPENPTLAECALAAVKVLSRGDNGFVLLVEGGAIDWGNHGNDLNAMIGEMIDYNNAIRAVCDWIDDPTSDSSWDNTLVIVTGDHESGYLTAGPGICSDKPLGEVSPRTIALMKKDSASEANASWEDKNGNDTIDKGETVYWAYNTGGHTNSLIPLFAKGAGADLFNDYALYTDPVRGRYIENTSIFEVMWLALAGG